MKYSRIRNRYLLILMGVWPTGAFAIALFAHRYGDPFAVLTLFWTVAIAAFTQRIKCPECGRPIGFGRSRFLGIQIEWWKAIPPRNCEYQGPKREFKRVHDTWISTLRLVSGWSLVAIGAVLMTVAQDDLACSPKCELVRQEVVRATFNQPGILGGALVLLGLALVPWARIIRPFRR